MIDNGEKVGRTFFDLLAEYPKLSFAVGVIILGIIALMVINGKHNKIGKDGIEVNIPSLDSTHHRDSSTNHSNIKENRSEFNFRDNNGNINIHMK